jgi:hypothetical protein
MTLKIHLNHFISPYCHRESYQASYAIYQQTIELIYNDQKGAELYYKFQKAAMRVLLHEK